MSKYRINPSIIIILSLLISFVIFYLLFRNSVLIKTIHVFIGILIFFIVHSALAYYSKH